jgi:hydrogenase nickel incorporation protein HypA/HybF
MQHAGGREVRSIRIRVGALRQIVPDTLEFCWSLATRDPLLKGSKLDIALVPAEVECVECGVRHSLSQFVLQCPTCQGLVSVVSGEELFVDSSDVVDVVDVVDADDADTRERSTTKE